MFHVELPVREEVGQALLSSTYTKFAATANPADVQLIGASPITASRQSSVLAVGGYAKVYRYAAITGHMNGHQAGEGGLLDLSNDSALRRPIADEFVVIKRFRAGPPCGGLPVHGVREMSALAELCQQQGDPHGPDAVQAKSSMQRPPLPPAWGVPRPLSTFVLKGRLHGVMHAAGPDLDGVLRRVHGWVQAANRAQCASMPCWQGKPSDPHSLFTPLFVLEDARHIGLGLACALRAAHGAGWVHQDVKPGNVLLSAGGAGAFSAPCVSLCDWGMCEQSGSVRASGRAVEGSAAEAVQREARAGVERGGETAASPLPPSSSHDGYLSDGEDLPPMTRWDGGAFPQVITPAYRPPELMMAARTHGCEVDVWSSGCVLAELLRAACSVAGAGREGGAAPTPRPSQPRPRWRAMGSSGQSSEDEEGHAPVSEDGQVRVARSAWDTHKASTGAGGPLFAGRGELEILAAQCSLLGPPSPVWPAVQALPGYMASTESCDWCKPGEGEGKEGLPAWILPATLASSCAVGPRPTPLLHTCAIPRLLSWLGKGVHVLAQGDGEGVGLWVDLILRCLAHDPARRPRAAEVCAHPALNAPTSPSPSTPSAAVETQWLNRLAHLCLGLETPPTAPAAILSPQQEQSPGAGMAFRAPLFFDDEDE